MGDDAHPRALLGVALDSGELADVVADLLAQPAHQAGVGLAVVGRRQAELVVGQAG